MSTHGLAKRYKDQRSVILIADGGSTDDTREIARDFQIKPWQEKITSIYRGPSGKGPAFRSVFEAAKRLKVKACMVDSTKIDRPLHIFLCLSKYYAALKKHQA